MNNVQKIFSIGLAASAIALSSTASAEVVVLPVAKDGYQFEPTVSLMLGTVQPSDSDADSQTIMGAELSFRCVLLQVGDNQLRQQLSFTQWEDNDFTAQNLEINAHYQIDVAKSTKVGFGPGVGLILTDGPVGDDPTYFAAQLGASAHYTGLGPVFLGAEWRYQLTTEESLGSGLGKNDMNNWRAAVKVGYSFY